MCERDFRGILAMVGNRYPGSNSSPIQRAVRYGVADEKCLVGTTRQVEAQTKKSRAKQKKEWRW